MRKILLLWLLLPFVAISQQKTAIKKTVASYFPSFKQWEKKNAGEAGFDTDKLNAAIRFAVQNESTRPRDIALSQQMDFGKEPYSDPIGPLGMRGDPTGLVIHKGYIVAQWGNPDAVEITNSVTKSFLSTVVGLAIDSGLIRNVQDKVVDYVPPVQIYNAQSNNPGELIYPFISEHNRTLSWEVMLRQTSDWEGSLWGKPDWADRPDPDPNKWMNRKRNQPGTVFEYNDVRVNALALATTCVWKKPLPQVFKMLVMDPIGASSSWQWYGYNNSWIVMDGLAVQSVSGGGHWGGGMFINSYDMGRFGLLTLHKGKWNGRQLISEKWIQQSLTPTAPEPTYGYMNFHPNTGQKLLPHAPANAFMHQGNGANIIYVDQDHDLVIVARWIQNKAIDEFVKQVLDAMNR